MSKFKIGDRVRRTESSDWPWQFGEAGKEYTVLDVPHGESIVVIEGMPGANASLFELVTPALTLTPGKFYRTASGAVTGRVTKGDTGFEAVVDGRVRIFDSAGGAVHGGDDIVEEWAPKVGERVVLSNSVGLAAEAGATAIVTAEFDDCFITVEWIRDEKSSAQLNGKYYIDQFEPLPVAAPAQPATTVAAQVDAIAEEYGPVFANDNKPAADVTISIGLDTGTLHEELDELIAKLKKIKKLQRAVGLAA